MAIHTHKEMYGIRTPTPEEVRAHIGMVMANPNFKGWPNRDFAATVIEDTVTPLHGYVSDGRWVSDCPCGGGIALTPGVSAAFCLDCGTYYTNITYACTSATITQAEKLLMYRPEQKTRNWRIDQGETLQQLKTENITRGLPIV